ncbi:MAG: hypothetical protein AAF206_15980, partial [Bacteroidota bacterium]
VGVKLDTLSLSSDTITQAFTMADLARQLIADGNIFGSIILASQGGSIPVLSALSGLTIDAVAIDASDFFEFAELESGELVLSINNQFPVDIENVILVVRNANLPGPDIVRDTFESIPMNSMVTETYNLSGKEIESQLIGELVNLDIPESTNVGIDTTDFINITLVAKNLRAKTATAIFPEQSLIDSVREAEYDLVSGSAGVQLTKVVVRSGKIRAETLSTVEDTIRFRYSLPAAFNNNNEVPFVDIKLKPAPPGGTSEEVQEASLGGFTLDMTGLNGNQVNTLVEQIQVSLLESGNLVTLDQTDSVNVRFGLVEIEPEYVEGFLGKQTFRYSGSEVIDVFRDLDLEKLSFTQPSASLTFANSVGMDARIQIDEFSAINTENGQKRQLIGSPILAGPVVITGPNLPDTNQIVLTSLPFTVENSNIGAFINVLADSLIYDLSVDVNHNGERGVFDNFATDESQISAYIDVDIPLDGIAQGLQLADTTDIDLSGTNIENIEGGTLKILIDNDFPFESRVTASVLDANQDLITNLATNQIIAAGVPNANGEVDEPVRSVIEKSFDLTLLQKVLDEGAFLAIRYRMDTSPADESVKIFANYRIRAKLVGEFTYQLSN